MPWFRLYAEMVDDPKLRLLAFEDRWHYVALLCLKCQGILDARLDLTQMRRMVAVKLGVDLRTLDEIERRLVAEYLIEKDSLQPLQWDKRQFQSDSSAQRTREWRDRQRSESGDGGVTSPKRHGDGLDADAEADTDDVPKGTSRSSRPKKVLQKHDYTPEFEEAWALYPKRPGMNKLETFRVWSTRLKQNHTAEQMIAGTKSYAASCRALNTEPQFIRLPATFFGPDCHFLTDYTPPPPRVVGGQSGAAGARAARSDWFNRMTGKNGNTNIGGNNERTDDYVDVSSRQVG